ncbi:MAG: hypothetical protein Q3997_00845 [Propionibacteriaceae bacterium]|nr:hypothetical protein [Propionibacteriaceae bacterium]
MTNFPLNILFEAPSDDWVLDPDQEQPTLLLRGDYPRFRPNVVVRSAELRPGVPLSDIADYLVDTLRPSSRDVEVLERRDTSEGEGTGYFQALTFKIKVGEEVYPLGQLTTLFEVAAGDAGRRWAYWLTLTALRDDVRATSEDFQKLVASATFEIPEPPTDESGQ